VAKKDHLGPNTKRRSLLSTRSRLDSRGKAKTRILREETEGRCAGPASKKSTKMCGKGRKPKKHVHEEKQNKIYNQKEDRSERLERKKLE